MSNWAVFKTIVSAAIAAGVVAGFLLTVIQQFGVAPILVEAELYEHAGTIVPSAGHERNAQGHQHTGLQPEDGLERTMLSAGSNIGLAVGFALLLAAMMSLSDRAIGWRRGLLWGLAGYVVFFIAPALGMPPEVPGTEAAGLTERQLWWLLTVLCTAAGLSLLAFGRTWTLTVPGVLLLLVPHLIGAPQPQIYSSTAPTELADSFVRATVLTNFVFWLALGGLVGLFYRKLA